MNSSSESICDSTKTHKRKKLAWQVKYEIIQDLYSGMANGVVARERGLNPSTVSTVWKYRKEFLAKFKTKIKLAENAQYVSTLRKLFEKLSYCVNRNSE